MAPHQAGDVPVALAHQLVVVATPRIDRVANADIGAPGARKGHQYTAEYTGAPCGHQGGYSLGERKQWKA